MEESGLQAEPLWVPLLGLYHVLTCIPSMGLGTLEAQRAFAESLRTRSLVTEFTSWWLCLGGTLWELLLEYGLLLGFAGSQVTAFPRGLHHP